MITFDASAILKAVSTLRELETIIRDLKDDDQFKSTNIVARSTANTIVKHLEIAKDAISGLNVRATALAIAELRDELVPSRLTMRNRILPEYISDILVTLRRELSLSKIFCIESSREPYFTAV